MSLINHIVIPNELWKNIYQTGSSVICNPPVTDTDLDYVIYTNNWELEDWFCNEGFVNSVKDDNEYDISVSSGMSCLRKDKINIIIVDDYIFYKRWVLATDLAKQFNLLKKHDRISLFQAILYPIGDDEFNFDDEVPF